MSDKLMELGSREKLKAITLEDNAFTDRRWLLGRNLNLQCLRYVNRYLCEQTTVNSEREKSGRIRGSCPARLPESWLGCATPLVCWFYSLFRPEDLARNFPRTTAPNWYIALRGGDI